MVIWWMMFRELIPNVLAYWFSINEEAFLFLPCTSSNKNACPLPWNFLSNCSRDNAFGHGVVCFDWGWWLGKIEFMECDAEGYSCFTIVKQSPDF